MGMNPYLEVVVKKQKVILKGEINKSYSIGDFPKVLRGLQKKYKNISKKKYDFFTGGAVGYWGYEMAAFFDKVKLRKKKNSKIPKLYLGYYRDIIAYDHKKKIYYLIANIKSKKTSVIQAQKALDRLEEKFEYFLRQTENQVKQAQPFSFKNFRPEISKFKFEQMVNRAKEYIRAGDIYQANLSQRFAFNFFKPCIPKPTRKVAWMTSWTVSQETLLLAMI
jgi:anthranilate/para-aminobenzoate synthase component I